MVDRALRRSVKMGSCANVFGLLAAMVTTVAVLGQESEGNIYNDHFPPLHPNCSQSLTDLLLLRQEGRLEETVKLLTDIRDSLARERKTSSLRKCPADFEDVDGLCLHLARDSRVPWFDALKLCRSLGGSLVNGLRNVEIGRAFLRASSVRGHVWVGGHDLFREGNWQWLSGEDIADGSSMWSYYAGVQQPNNGGSGEDCIGLYRDDNFNIHDLPCDWDCLPLCEADHYD